MFAVVKIFRGYNGIWTHDLRDTDARLTYQASPEAGQVRPLYEENEWEFMKRVFLGFISNYLSYLITAKISFAPTCPILENYCSTASTLHLRIQDLVKGALVQTWQCSRILPVFAFLWAAHGKGGGCNTLTTHSTRAKSTTQEITKLLRTLVYFNFHIKQAYKYNSRKLDVFLL